MAGRTAYDKVDEVLEVLETAGLHLRDELQKAEWDRRVADLKWSTYKNTFREGNVAGNSGEEKHGYLSKTMIPVYVAHAFLVGWAVVVGLSAWGIWVLLMGAIPGEGDAELRAAITTGVVAGGFFMARRSIEAFRGLATQWVVSMLIKPFMDRLPGIGFTAWVQMAHGLGVSSYTFDKNSGEEDQLKRIADSVDKFLQRSSSQQSHRDLLNDDPSYWTQLEHKGHTLWVHVPGTPEGVHIPYVRYYPAGRSIGLMWRCSCGFVGDSFSFDDLTPLLEENGVEWDINIRDRGPGLV